MELDYSDILKVFDIISSKNVIGDNYNLYYINYRVLVNGSKFSDRFIAKFTNPSINKKIHNYGLKLSTYNDSENCERGYGSKFTYTRQDHSIYISIKGELPMDIRIDLYKPYKGLLSK